MFSQKDAEQYTNRWIVKRRLKYCADCAPKVLDPGTGKMTRNRTQSITRPAPLELPALNVSLRGNKDVSLLDMRRQAGIDVAKEKPGPAPASVAPRAVRKRAATTEGFEAGSGEGK
jgi:hypothetical protein